MYLSNALWEKCLMGKCHKPLDYDSKFKVFLHVLFLKEEKMNPDRNQFMHRSSSIDDSRNIRCLIHNWRGMLWQNSALRIFFFFHMTWHFSKNNLLYPISVKRFHFKKSTILTEKNTHTSTKPNFSFVM